MEQPDNRELNPVVRRVLEEGRRRRGDAELFKPRPCSEEFTGETRVIDGVEYVVLTGVYVHRLSAKAIQITFSGEVFWVAKQAIHEHKDFRRWQEDCRMLVAVWYARKYKLI